MSARTDGDLIVFFEAPSPERGGELTGAIRRVRITGSDRLSLHGVLE